MATTVSSASVIHAPQSRHFLAHPRAASPHNAFEAFSMHRHGHAQVHSYRSPSPAAASASWRAHDPIDNIAPGEQPSHSRTPSASARWKSRSRTPRAPQAVARSAAAPAPRAVTPAAHAPAVYSAVDLLALASSPLVGLPAAAQTAVADLVAHHVWRRAPRSASSSRKSAGQSRSRSRSRRASPKRTAESASSADDESN